MSRRHIILTSLCNHGHPEDEECAAADDDDALFVGPQRWEFVDDGACYALDKNELNTEIETTKIDKIVVVIKNLNSKRSSKWIYLSSGGSIHLCKFEYCSD